MCNHRFSGSLALRRACQMCHICKLRLVLLSTLCLFPQSGPALATAQALALLCVLLDT